MCCNSQILQQNALQSIGKLFAFVPVDDAAATCAADDR